MQIINNQERMINQHIKQFLTLLLFLSLISTVLIINYNPTIAATKNETSDVISLVYTFNEPLITTETINNKQYTQMKIENLPLKKQNNEMLIPVQPVRLLLPQSTTVKEISVKASSTHQYHITSIKKNNFSTKTFRIENMTFTSQNTTNISSVSSPTLCEYNHIQYFRGYPILQLNLYPIQINDSNDLVDFYDQITIEITTKMQNTNTLYRNLLEDQKELEQKVDNYQSINTYQIPKPATSLGPEYYDYIIIASENVLQNNTEYEYTFDDLISYRENQGLSCRIKTVEEITAEYDGIDTCEQIRNFIKDAYLNWGTTWVLLAGDVETVPIRLLKDIDGEDFIVSSDLYYQCLDGNYNYDHDSYWGEKYDGVDGEMIDLFAEVYVGRAPVDNAKDVSAFVEKTLSYENSNWDNDSYLKRHLSAGEHVWSGEGGYGAGYLERTIDYCTDYDQQTYGIPSNKYDIITYYERDDPWSYPDVMYEINQGVNIINHVGHGSSNAAMKISVFNIDALQNEGKYPLFYSQACHSGKLQSEDDCIAEVWINKEKAGGFAAIMNTGVGYGATADYDGIDNRYTREFFDALFSPYEKISRIGKANQDSKEDNYWRIEEDQMHMFHVYYDTLLFGDPYVQIKGAEDTIADFTWGPIYPKTDQTITFHDSSSGTIIQRQWDFDDGQYSNQENPTHHYNQPGKYNVELTIWDENGYSSSVNYEIEVKKYWSPIVNATYDFNGENEFTINFDAGNSWDPDGTIISYEWDFDDQTFSSEVNPIHIFPSEGLYQVQLLITDDEHHMASATLSIHIQEHTPPITPPKPNGLSTGIIGNLYTFTIKTTDEEGYKIKYGWDWGDGSPLEWTDYYSSDESCTMMHIWQTPGIYNITVIAKNKPGVISEWSPVLMIDIHPNDVPLISINKPSKGLYYNNNKVLPLFFPLVIGDTNISFTVYDEGTIEKVELYIDGELKENISFDSNNYLWTWNEKTPFSFRHKIHIVVHDNLGEQGSIQQIVWKIL